MLSTVFPLESKRTYMYTYILDYSPTLIDNGDKINSFGLFAHIVDCKNVRFGVTLRVWQTVRRTFFVGGYIQRIAYRPTKDMFLCTNRVFVGFITEDA